MRKGSGAPSAKNLANAFTPMEPMTREGMNPERLRAMGDVPKALKQALDQGMERIGLSCLKENAVILLSVYEDICLKHVLDQQIHSKDLKKLLAVRDAGKDQDHANQKKVASNVVAHSSLIGEDPWGEREVPETALSTEGEDNADESAYSKEQQLLMRIQDRNYLYLVAHVGRILDDVIATTVRARELVYERDEEGVREAAARKRMPWSEYKEVILEHLSRIYFVLVPRMFIVQCKDV